METTTARRCCKWHDCLPSVVKHGSLPDISAKRHQCLMPLEDNLIIVCCADCPRITRKIIANGIDFAKEIAEQQ